MSSSCSSFPPMHLFLHTAGMRSALLKDTDCMWVAMEDAHVAALSLDEDSPDPNTFFAVYDGHGGELSFTSAISHHASSCLYPRLRCGEVCGATCTQAPSSGRSIQEEGVRSRVEECVHWDRRRHAVKCARCRTSGCVANI